MYIKYRDANNNYCIQPLNLSMHEEINEFENGELRKVYSLFNFNLTECEMLSSIVDNICDVVTGRTLGCVASQALVEEFEYRPMVTGTVYSLYEKE